MSTIKGKLKEGIIKKNWKLVSEAYEALSGEKIDTKEENDSDEFLFKMRASTDTKSIKPVERIVEEKNEKKVIAKEIDFTKENRFNMFSDDGKDFKSDKKFDKNVKPKKLSEKGVRKFNTVTTKCNKCGQQELVHPDLKKGYICDSCQSGMSR